MKNKAAAAKRHETWRHGVSATGGVAAAKMK
jgi:hypothetical protein